VNTEKPVVLGLFPEFSSEHLGGIQESARIAWDAISNAARTELICYARNGNGRSQGAADSRIKTVLSAVRKQCSTDVVLVWQVGLIKLLPFLRCEPKCKALFLHGVEVWREPGWLTSRLASGIELFLSNSEHTWRRFIDYNPSLSGKQHEIVPLGIGLPLSSTPLEPASPPRALMLSRLSKAEDYKGHREVIDAWPLVLKKDPDATLLIAGDGDLQTELEGIVSCLGLTKNIRFLGRITEEAKQRLLVESRCLLMPSRGEGFGLVYLEAMRLGRPSLVSTLDAGREVVNPPEAGLAVNPTDRDATADAIIRLMSDGLEWNEWSQRARSRYESNFTARHFQERLLKALFLNSQSRKSVP
jgi:phosphatidylinositol alpha-1,6-mannosyltransferase